MAIVLFISLLKEYEMERIVSSSTTSGEGKVSDYSNECQSLKNVSKDLKGISVSCGLKNNKQTTIQNINYKTVDLEDLTAAFTESGGTNPEYELDDSIDTIKSNMETSGFKCIKAK